MKRVSVNLLWIEVALAIISAACLAATLIWPHWIEDLTGLEPDGGDGSTEWGWAIGFGLATILFAVAVRRRLKRASSVT